MSTTITYKQHNQMCDAYAHYYNILLFYPKYTIFLANGVNCDIIVMYQVREC